MLGCYLPAVFARNSHNHPHPNAKMCSDGTRLMPECTQCIPGLLAPHCGRMSNVTIQLRESLMRIGKERYGGSASFHLYPYLERPEMQGRQALLAQWMASQKPQHILDIGPYVSPIKNWLRHCPAMVVAVEPCGELATGIMGQPWLSTRMPCPTDPSKTFVYTVAPTTIREFQALAFASATPFDGIVCTGCDGHFGPQISFFKQLERPFSLYIEHTPAYPPSAMLLQQLLELPAARVISSALLNFSGGTGFQGIEKPFRENRLVQHLQYNHFASGRSRSPGNTRRSGKQSTYLQIARKAEAIAAALGDRVYFTRQSAAEHAALWGNTEWVAGVKHASAPVATLSPEFFITYRFLWQVLQWNRKQHSHVSSATAESLTHCSRHNILQCPPRELINTMSCASDAACRACACKFVSSSALGKDCQPASNPDDVCKAHASCMPLYAAASAVCATTLNMPIVDRLLLTGFAYDMVHGDDAAPNRLGLDRARLGSQLAAGLATWIGSAGEVQQLQDAVPRRIITPLTCPNGSWHATPLAAISQLEPLYVTGRNLFCHETGDPISFVPYRPLPSVPGYAPDRAAMVAAGHRVMLIDVGSNGFYASPKRLIDLYEHHLPFHDVILIEPDSEGMQVPAHYSTKYNITVEQKHVRVGTRRVKDDLLTWLNTFVTVDDYVVLKFDVDDHISVGSTIEWGFLSDLVHNAAALSRIDELYIELHFQWNIQQPRILEHRKHLGWYHSDHSMAQQFEALRELRRCGVAVHAWP